MLGGAYVSRMVGNLRLKIGLAYSWKEINHFFFVLLYIGGQISSISPPGEAYIRRGDLTEGFSALRFWGAPIWRGLPLIHGGGHGGAYTVYRRGPQGQAGNLLEGRHILIPSFVLLRRFFPLWDGYRFPYKRCGSLGMGRTSKSLDSLRSEGCSSLREKPLKFRTKHVQKGTFSQVGRLFQSLKCL